MFFTSASLARYCDGRHGTANLVVYCPPPTPQPSITSHEIKQYPLHFNQNLTYDNMASNIPSTGSNVPSTGILNTNAPPFTTFTLAQVENMYSTLLAGKRGQCIRLMELENKYKSLPRCSVRPPLPCFSYWPMLTFIGIHPGDENYKG